jgi:hypothetical protein
MFSIGLLLSIPLGLLASPAQTASAPSPRLKDGGLPRGPDKAWDEGGGSRL